MYSITAKKDLFKICLQNIWVLKAERLNVSSYLLRPIRTEAECRK